MRGALERAETLAPSKCRLTVSQCKMPRLDQLHALLTLSCENRTLVRRNAAFLQWLALHRQGSCCAVIQSFSQASVRGTADFRVVPLYQAWHGDKHCMRSNSWRTE